MKKLWALLGILIFTTQAHCKTIEKILEIENYSNWPLRACIVEKDNPTEIIEETINSGEVLAFEAVQFGSKRKNSYMMNITAVNPDSLESTSILTQEFVGDRKLRITAPLVDHVVNNNRNWAH